MTPSGLPARVASRWLSRQASVRFKGAKTGKAFRILYRAFVESMVGKSLTVDLHPRKSMGRQTGHVTSQDLDRGHIRIFFLTGYPPYALRNIGHELTHVLQYKRGDLAFEGNKILWKGHPYMTKEEYDVLDYAGHGNLPWEAEAKREGEAKAAAFLRSAPTALRGKSPALDYMFDNDLL